MTQILISKGNFYSVEVWRDGGIREISRSFPNIGQARKWRDWCAKIEGMNARIMRGGPGGMEVK